MGHLLRLANTKSTIPRCLDIFSAPATDTSIENITEKEYYNQGDSHPGSNVVFIITGASGEYVDLRESTLHLTCRISKLNDDNSTENLGEDDFCGPVNLPLHSFFRQIDVRVNSKTVSDLTPTNPYAAMFHVLTQYGTDATEGYMQNMMYVKDTAGQLDDNAAHPRTSLNFGLRQRCAWTRNKDFTLSGPFFSDIFKIDRFLPNGVKIELTLVQSPDAFRLIAPDRTKRFQLHIKNAMLRLKIATINPMLFVGHNAAFKEGEVAKYPYIKTDFRTRVWEASTITQTYDDVFNGNCPGRVIMGMVTNNSYAGDITTNPFYFQDFDIRNISLKVNSKQYNGRDLTMNFLQGDISEPYTLLYQSARRWNGDKGLTISRNDFLGGFTLFVFDLENRHADDYNYPLMETGNLTVTMTFGSPGPAEKLTIMFMGLFRGVFGIDSARNINLVDKIRPK